MRDFPGRGPRRSRNGRAERTATLSACRSTSKGRRTGPRPRVRATRRPVRLPGFRSTPSREHHDEDAERRCGAGSVTAARAERRHRVPRHLCVLSSLCDPVPSGTPRALRDRKPGVRAQGFPSIKTSMASSMRNRGPLRALLPPAVSMRPTVSGTHGDTCCASSGFRDLTMVFGSVGCSRGRWRSARHLSIHGHSRDHGLMHTDRTRCIPAENESES